MDPERARMLLARERERIERALADLTADDSRWDVDIADPVEPAPILFEDELQQGLADALREELDAIRRAEQRLAEGKYGLSVESGRPIPDERLEAIPWAERTAEEQERFERTPPVTPS
jgi:DnaK suppressor protein